MRLLGIDYGFKRIGLAVAETSPEVVSPRPSLAASGVLARDAEALFEVAKKEQVEGVVLGIPLEDNGADGKMARIMRRIAGLLEEKGLTVHLVDESLSSIEANQHMEQLDLKASERKKRRDGEAACIILERFLHEEKAS